MKFRSSYSEPILFESPSGSRYRKNYLKAYNDDGTSELIENGIEDVYDSIQKAAPGNVIEDLIRRAQSGDVTAIPAPIDSFVDIADMPTDLLSMHSKLMQCRAQYDSLPADVRSLFNNSYSDFLKSVGDGSLAEKLSQLSQNSGPQVSPLTADEIQKIRSTIGGSANA